MHKFVLIVYNEAIDEEVMKLLEKAGIEVYTKINGVLGKGLSSGAHLGTDVWPGRNNLLFVVCKDNDAQKIFLEIKLLRQKLRKEGLKAFMLRIEDLT